MHSSSKEEKENPWWKKLLLQDEEKRGVVVADKTEELKTKAYEWQTKNEKGEEMYKFDYEKSKTMNMLSGTRVQKMSHEVEREFKEHEEKHLKQSPSKWTASASRLDTDP